MIKQHEAKKTDKKYFYEALFKLGTRYLETIDIQRQGKILY